MKTQSRIMTEMFELADGLNQSGLISKESFAEIQALCKASVEEITPIEIKSLRNSWHVSQAVFASMLNTSISTVQKWEIGDKKPSGPSLKLLNIAKKHGVSALI